MSLFKDSFGSRIRRKQYMPVIFFEGADGSGKNSLIDKIFNNLKDSKNVRIYEDGYGLTYPEEYSNLIKKPKISNKARFLLFQSLRVDLYQKILDDYTNDPNTLILVNRSILSSLVYQCLAHYDYNNPHSPTYFYYNDDEFKKNNYSIHDFSEIMEKTLPFNFINKLWPITVYLKCSLETSISRDSKMCDWNHSKTTIDKKNFLRNVILCYNSIFQTDPTFNGNVIINTLFDQLNRSNSLFTVIFESNNIILDANKPQDVVFNEFMNKIGKIIE